MNITGNQPGNFNSNPNMNYYSQPQPPKKNNNSILLIIGSVLILAAAGFIFFIVTKNDPDEHTVNTKAPATEETKAPSEQKNNPQSQDEMAVKSVIDTWLMCWETRDINCYESYITSDYIFAPSDKPSQSYSTRLKTISGHFKTRTYIHITHDKMDVDLSGDNAVVSYFQRYSSNEYSDAGYKKVYLRKVNGTWKIYKDTFTPSK